MATAARVAPLQAEVESPAQPIAKNPIEDYHWLRCKTIAEVPVPRFTVGDLLHLRKGAVVQTATRVANDIPVTTHNTVLGWGRFEVVNDRLAVRITELA
jgi:flagellar motor switch/type III secretory pathway protein FliN